MRTELYYKNRINLLRARDEARGENLNMRIVNALKREYKKKFNKDFE